MMTPFLATTGVYGQRYDMDTLRMIPHCIHKGSVTGINGNDGERALFDPDGVPMCTIILWPSVGCSGSE
jgi:hypothetical protein